MSVSLVTVTAPIPAPMWKGLSCAPVGPAILRKMTVSPVMVSSKAIL